MTTNTPFKAHLQNELDLLLLADFLHDKKCKKSHSNLTVMIPYCNYHTHNKNKELSERVTHAQRHNKYYKQAQTLMNQCENMNTKQIVNIIKIIMED